jgi:hypothetical protein
MQAVRTRVRTVALVWLLSQAASLAAFVPEQCCASHVHEAAAKEATSAKDEACHEAEPPKPEPGDACPMGQGDGTACPMHSSKSSSTGCEMRNTCDGPGAHLLTLFAYLGAIERPVAGAVVLESAPAHPRTVTSPHLRTVAPDSPPPKA